MSEVFVKHGERKLLAGIFGVTPRCVRNALVGESKSKLAEKIRKCAVERGGIESTPKK